MELKKEEWDAKKLGGSVRLDIVNPDLLEERAKLAFDKREMFEFTVGRETAEEMDEINHEIQKDPNLQTDLSFLEMTREQQHYTWWRIISAAYNNPVLGPKHFLNNSKRTNIGFCWSYMF